MSERAANVQGQTSAATSHADAKTPAKSANHCSFDQGNSDSGRLPAPSLERGPALAARDTEKLLKQAEKASQL